MVTKRTLDHASLDAGAVTSCTPSRLMARWLGQSGFELSTPESRVVIDPFLSEYPGRLVAPPITPDHLAAADAVLVSHEHADHLDLPALASMHDSATVVVVPAPLAQDVRGALPGREVIAARAGEPLAIGGTVITPIPALHGLHTSEAYGFDRRGDEYPYLGYVVELGGISVYHAGDGLDYPELAPALERLGVDVALLPINGRDPERESLDIVGNMSADEAVSLAVRAGVPLVVPMHYDMFANNRGPVGQFVDAVRTTSQRLHVLVPGLGIPFLLPIHPLLTARTIP